MLYALITLLLKSLIVLSVICISVIPQLQLALQLSLSPHNRCLSYKPDTSFYDEGRPRSLPTNLFSSTLTFNWLWYVFFLPLRVISTPF